METGIIYKATNKFNKKGYVGQTTQTLEERIKQHFNRAYQRHERDGYVFNYPFYCAIRKYGVDNFEWEIVYVVATGNLNLFEVWSIAKHETYVDFGKGYNVTIGGEGTIGLHLSDETKKRMSDSKKGDKHPRFGLHLSDEQKKHLSILNKGKKHTEEAKKKISQNRKTKKHSDETRKRMSEDKMGAKNPFSGKHHTDESKAKISKGNKGKVVSEETRKKMSENSSNIKLTNEQKNMIFEMYKSGNYYMKQLAALFGVNRNLIGKIISKIKITYGHGIKA